MAEMEVAPVYVYACTQVHTTDIQCRGEIRQKACRKEVGKVLKKILEPRLRDLSSF